LLTDLFPRGPYWDIWGKVFSFGKHPARTAYDLKREIEKKRGNTSYRHCFRNLGVAIVGPASPFTLIIKATECKRSGLLRAYSDFVIRGMQLQHLVHYAQPAPLRKIVVTWIARRIQKVTATATYVLFPLCLPLYFLWF
jgi:hypothetical protein